VKRVAVIGAGISGLSTAYYLSKAAETAVTPFEIWLLEKSSDLGGVIRSEKENGLLLEAGPEGWASYKPSAASLAEELGLGESLLGSNDFRRKTYIARGGSLAPLPDGMTFLAPVDPWSFWRTAPISTAGKLRTFCEPFVTRSRGDLSVRAFFARRLGQEFTDHLVEPLISAIYGADFEEVSAPASIPELYRTEQRFGSLWRGLRRFAKLTLSKSVLLSLKNGMSELTQALAENLGSVQVVRGLTDAKLSIRDGSRQLESSICSESFDAVVIATPANAASTLLESVSEELAALLQEVPYSSSSIVYLAYKKAEFSHPRDGFGFIVPREEAGAFDACTWVDQKFDYRSPDDVVLLRCAVHDRRTKRSASDPEMTLELAHREVQRLMGVRCSPVYQRLFRVRHGIPQLLVGHVGRIKRLTLLLESLPGIYFATNYVGGVGIPDCIKTARETAVRVVADLGV
jgi:oxygen-dependent protoporphyrinogen oxidase